MRSQSGNFLLQALLAVSLMVAFMPMMTRKIADYSARVEFGATADTINLAANAAKLYIREESELLPFGITTLSGLAMSDALEPFGLPIGFRGNTPLDQKISLVVLRDPGAIDAYLVIERGNLSPLKLRELAARVGFWAASGTGFDITAFGGGWAADVSAFGWRPSPKTFLVRIPLENEFTERVQSYSKNPADDAFLADLDMSEFDVRNIKTMWAANLSADSAMISSLTLAGTEEGRKIKNKIAHLSLNRAIFLSDTDGSALGILKNGTVAQRMTAATISQFGSSGAIETDVFSIYDLSMSAGRAGFYGPEKWNIGGSMATENISLGVSALEIGGLINAARGQEVFVSDDGMSYSAKTGIEADYVAAAHITLRDQISSSLSAGGTGPVIMDIRPAGVSVFDDVILENLDSSALKIIHSASDSTGKTTDCKNVIYDLTDISYNAKSVAQNIICQYVYWQRLEQRINIKKCLVQGKSNCG
ncbi:MAG: hypothetical protein LBO08_01190 [Rickettsiales bacterium]|nr:hypothetical protein [Rickettsiales bacterium]